VPRRCERLDVNTPSPILYRKGFLTWRTLDCGVLSALAGLIFFTVSRHEPWTDEAQAWLIARDFGWFRMIFTELRYEGHPALWYVILWPAIHLCHLPYACFGYFGATFAIAGLAVLIFLAPFPPPLRYLIAGSFFFVYQYAVIARSYVLLPLLAFSAAYFYRKGLTGVVAFASCIALLIQVSTYAAVIGAGFAAFYGFQLFTRRAEISVLDRRRAIVAFALVILSVATFFIVVFPPTDSSVMATSNAKPMQERLERCFEGLVGGLSDSAAPTFLLLLLTALWGLERRALPLLVLGVGGTAAVYGVVWGFGHHQGMITIAFVVFLWAAWPTSEDFAALTIQSKWIHRALLTSLILTFAWHCTWSYTAIRKDWSRPYSGALDAAKFLKSVHADELGARGYNYWAIGVQPYFDHNIFTNVGGPDAPASRHSSLEADRRVQTMYPDEIQTGSPFIVLALEEPPGGTTWAIDRLAKFNYRLVHTSDGTRFFKNTDGRHALYLIFAREDWVRAEAMNNSTPPDSQSNPEAQ
jgi:hypothetical protein